MRSWLALLSILVVCALGARFLRGPVVSPVERVREGLRLFWPGVDSDALVQGQEMHVAVRFPPGTRERQKQWTYDLVRFLGAKKWALTVFDGASGKSVARESRASIPADFSNRSYWELAHAVKLQRYAQSDLDGKLGPGSTLLLVDVESIGSRAVTRPRLYGANDPPQNFHPVDPYRIARIHACLVVSGPDLVEEAQLSVRPALDEKRGDDLRIVVIP